MGDSDSLPFYFEGASSAAVTRRPQRAGTVDVVATAGGALAHSTYSTIGGEPLAEGSFLVFAAIQPRL